MTPDARAALHALCFDAAPRPWSAVEFADLLAQPSTFAMDHGAGFVIGRVAADEAELLTLVVDPLRRRSGVGGALVAAFESTSRGRGAREAFLEVAADNAAARGLYLQAGYRDVARRSAYHRRPGLAAIDAIVMRKTLLGSNANAPCARQTH